MSETKYVNPALDPVADQAQAAEATEASAYDLMDAKGLEDEWEADEEKPDQQDLDLDIDIEIDEPTDQAGDKPVGDPEPDDEYDLEDEFTEDPYEQKTEPQLSENGFLRVAVMGGSGLVAAALLVIGASNMDLKGLISGMREKNVKAQASQVKEPPKQPNDPKIKADGKMGQIALADQSVKTTASTEALAARTRAADLEKRTKEIQANRDRDNATQANPRPTTPPASARVYVPRSNPRTQPVAYRPPVQPARVRSSFTQPPANRPTKAKVDPHALYAQITQVGRFGKSYRTDSDQGNNTVNASLDQQSQDLGELLLNPNEVITAQLESPMIWGGTNSIKKGLAVVTEGNDMIPTGTLLAVASESDGGGKGAFVDLKITHAYIGEDSRIINGTTQILKGNGEPLEAKKKGTKGGSFLPTVGKALLGAIGAGTGLLTRADSVVTTSGGVSSSVTTSGNQDFVLGALHGVSDTLLEDLNARNKAAIDRQQGGEYYIVPAGQQLQIRAISPIQG